MSDSLFYNGLPLIVLGIAYNNVTSLSSTHCSAPSAWPFWGNNIGFSRFWRKLASFCTRNEKPEKTEKIIYFLMGSVFYWLIFLELYSRFSLWVIRLGKLSWTICLDKVSRQSNQQFIRPIKNRKRSRSCRIF